MTPRIFCLAVLLWSLCGYCASASAQACGVASAPVAFGGYNPFSDTATDTAGSVTVTCKGLVRLQVNYTIKLDGGVSGVLGSRQMRIGTSAKSNLFYQLYSDSARKIVWGDDTGGSESVSDDFPPSVGTVAKTYPIYGRITARQNVLDGSYLDTVTILLTY
jgi:spore coat protein U-like protein